MIPDRELFTYYDGTNYDFDKIKDAFEYIGAINIKPTEDQYGGFTCMLGTIPMHVLVNDNNKYKVKFLLGPNDEQKFVNEAYIAVRYIVAYKGSTGSALRFIGYNSSNSPCAQFICCDHILGNVYTVADWNYAGSIYGYVYQFRIEDDTCKRSYNQLDGNLITGDFNTSKKAIIEKLTFNSQMLESAPAKYKPSILTNVGLQGEVIQVDDKYYLVTWVSSSNLGGTALAMNKNFIGSLIFPLGE